MAVLPPDPVYCFRGDMGYVHSLCFPNQLQNNYVDTLLASTESGKVYFWNLEVTLTILERFLCIIDVLFIDESFETLS